MLKILRFPLLIALLAIAPSVFACMWDSDTLAMETKSFPELPQIISGRFERNPPLYYELRLDRVRRRLATSPDDLNAYDDAGVACDRLGRGDEAIDWMRRKQAQLARMDAKVPFVHDHLYRYHANMGTFLAHRWLRKGADRAHMEDIRAGRDHIAQGIVINPDAHFGREKYQLYILEWIIKPYGADHKPRILLDYLLDRIHSKSITAPNAALDAPQNIKEIRKAIRGISGLIVLGNGWESVDLFAVLTGLLLEDRDASVAHLASLRCDELIRAGKRSLLPGAPKERDALMELLRIDFDLGTMPFPLMSENRDYNEALFPKLRKEADDWSYSRTNYMLTGLRNGFHPDTAPDFWKDYHPTDPPSVELPWPRETLHQRYGPYWRFQFLLVMIPIALILVLFAAWRLWKRWKRKRQRRVASAPE